MIRRVALGGLGLCGPLLLVGFWVPGPLGAWLLIATAGLVPIGLIALGTSRADGGNLPAAFFLLLVALLDGSLAALWILHRRGGGAASGPPLAALVQLGGLWLLPFVLVVLVYALTFERFGLAERDLAELRRRRAGAGPGDES